MKLLEKDFALNQRGSVKIIAEEPDDVWLLYNLITIGDVVTAETTRKVHLESTKNTASRVKLALHLKVTCRDFQKDSSTLRVHGRNLEPNQHVAAGSFHTLTLERNKPFHLEKKKWSSQAVETLAEVTEDSSFSSSSSSSDANLLVVVLQQHQAEIHLLGKQVTTRCSKIEASSSSHSHKKSSSSSSSSSNMFYREVFVAFMKHVDFNIVKCVVITGDSDNNTPISPVTFRRFLLSEAKRLKIKCIEENKSRIVVVGSRCNNDKLGNCDFDLKDVLSDVTVMKLIKNNDLGLEIRTFKELWDMVCNNSDRVCYGPRHVESAHEMNAIETLLISDDLYRNEDIEMRKKYVRLVKSVKESGGKALVYSSMHVSAPQLAHLTGVAAILRFPLPSLQDMDEDDHHAFI